LHRPGKNLLPDVHQRCKGGGGERIALTLPEKERRLVKLMRRGRKEEEGNLREETIFWFPRKGGRVALAVWREKKRARGPHEVMHGKGKSPGNKWNIPRGGDWL